MVGRTRCVPGYLISYRLSVYPSPLDSRRFLQPLEHALRHNHRILYSTRGPPTFNVCRYQIYLTEPSRIVAVSNHVCRSKVAVRAMCGQCAHRSLGRYEYLWEDGVKYKRPTKLSAPEYVDALMNWAQSLLDNEEYFPNQIGTSPSSI